MKRLILILVSIIFLTGCSDKNIDTSSDSDNKIEITTFKEIIKEDKVEIDGVSYDIHSVTTKTVTYDENDYVVKEVRNDEYKPFIKDGKVEIDGLLYDVIDEDGNAVTEMSNDEFSVNNTEYSTEYFTEDNLLVKKKEYIDGNLSSTSYYDYEGDKLVKAKQTNENGLEIIFEYSYGDGFTRVSIVNSEDEWSYISTINMDENDRILRIDNSEDGETTTFDIYHYEDDELIKIVGHSEGKIVSTINYEYNNIGDIIVEYCIYYQDIIKLNVQFYDYEYNNDMLPKTVTVYKVQTQIEKEDIREY